MTRNLCWRSKTKKKKSSSRTPLTVLNWSIWNYVGSIKWCSFEHIFVSTTRLSLVQRQQLHQHVIVVPWVSPSEYIKLHKGYNPFTSRSPWYSWLVSSCPLIPNYDVTSSNYLVIVILVQRSFASSQVASNVGRQLSHLVCWKRSSFHHLRRRKSGLKKGLTLEWMNGMILMISTMTFCHWIKYRRALVHALHVVTFYDRSAKERQKQVSSSVNSLATLWIAAYYAP